MFEALLYLAAAAAVPAQAAPQAPDCAESAATVPPALDPGTIEMTYNAFVAIEETAPVGEMVRPAIGAAPVGQPAIGAATGTAWIS